MAKRRRADDAPVGRERILDAAERLFAQRGYDGASLRDIARSAQVELGLTSYHFGTKDELFRQVLFRRSPEHARNLAASLAEALLHGEGTGQKAVHAILHAYVVPHVASLVEAEEGWRSYIRVIGYSYLLSSRPHLYAGLEDIFGSVMRDYRDALGKSLPQMPPDELDRAFHGFRMSIVSIVVDATRDAADADDHAAFAWAGDMAQTEAVAFSVARYFAAGLAR
jgi:AcrR family transcriptional regulator